LMGFHLCLNHYRHLLLRQLQGHYRHHRRRVSRLIQLLMKPHLRRQVRR
jgi:hypothetical protein